MKRKIIVSNDIYFIAGVTHGSRYLIAGCSYDYYVKNSYDIINEFDVVIFDVFEHGLDCIKSVNNIKDAIKKSGAFFVFWFRCLEGKVSCISNFNVNYNLFAFFSKKIERFDELLMRLEIGNIDILPRFSQREILIMTLLNKGFTVYGCSSFLKKNYKTINSQKRSAMKKIGVNSTIQLLKAINVIFLV